MKKQKEIYKYSGYTHLDRKRGWKGIQSLVENPRWVVRHGFYPFIHFTIVSSKVNSSCIRKEKRREIYYSAHIDRYIYQKYAYQLNLHYNTRAIRDCINKCAIAYRDNLHKSNIHYAKDVFDFIKNSLSCWIIVGDFTNFFDNLDHEYLKERICDLLKTKRIPDDYYTIFKNVTRFAYVDFKDLLKLSGKTKKEFRNLDKAVDMDEFRKVKHRILKVNRNNFGIPQGSPVSSVFSNIYMLVFDLKLNNYANSLSGLYRRYSDDFVIVIPKRYADIKNIWEFVEKTRQSIPRLDVQSDKVHIFSYDNSVIKNISDTIFPEQCKGKDALDYLGFTFDGQKVEIRDKTIHKYYSRLYKKIDICNKYSLRYGRNVFRRKLYRLYSYKGMKTGVKYKGNFLTYVDRAQRIFGVSEPIKNKTKNHWRKISKRLMKVDTD